LLKLSSESKDQFSFVADEFCELVHTNEIAMFASLPDLPVRNMQDLDIIFHSNVVGVFEVCLELPSNLKHQFGVVAGEFSELENTRKSLACMI